MQITALIPAYNPDSQLVRVVEGLSSSGITDIVVVDDGSQDLSQPIFSAIEKFPKVTLLRHAVNLGKGAAIKTGLNYIYIYFPDYIGVVTLDADGQHLTEDILNVADTLLIHPENLVIGARWFDNEVPLRSKFGNIATRFLFKLLIGQKLTDTQSGLRGIPMDFIPFLLKIDSNGYEFELDMLLASKYSGRHIIERKIQTIYTDGNKSSHFNPLLDSMKIYFVLFRFIFTSSITAVIDYTVFLLMFSFTASLISSQVAARMSAMVFNYSAVRKLVFYSEKKHSQTFPRYATLVFASGFISYLMISVIIKYTLLNVITAKVISELTVFIANFAIQRDFIFTHNRDKTCTDWDRYYCKPYKTATFTRKITEGILHRLIRQYVPHENIAFSICELGGANSCFYEGIKYQYNPAQYLIIDNNELGLERFSQRIDCNDSVILKNEDILNLGKCQTLDLVFSVGLIEHFGIDDTKKAIAAHFQLLKPQGIAIISFPTPTLLYRITRFLFELLGLWIFHDERPLRREEVANTINKFGTILYDKVIWLIFLTQRIVVVKNNN